jgi:ABC-type transport system involved in cytochrome bd biosynthesis fused ATPase/permease subunit
LKRQFGITVIMISHQMENFLGFDEIWLLKNSKIKKINNND